MRMYQADIYLFLKFSPLCNKSIVSRATFAPNFILRKKLGNHQNKIFNNSQIQE